MNFKEFIQDYLSFTRKERIGVLCLITLIFSISFLPNLVQKKADALVTPTDTSWFSLREKFGSIKLDSTVSETQFHQYDYSTNGTTNSSDNKLFYFNPNTISVEEWKKLNLRENTIKTIANYLKKGGHFYKPEDLKKIYGLRTNDFERLLPFIRIDPTTETSTSITNAIKKIDAPIFKTPIHLSIDINIADSAAFISLPGIGTKLAARIITFRNKLGGFYSVEQIRETYALPDSTFQKIKNSLSLETQTIKKIDINTTTADELKDHPYIRWTLANTIIAFRNQHGTFKNLEELKKIVSISDEVYNKISPYLIVQ